MLNAENFSTVDTRQMRTALVYRIIEASKFSLPVNFDNSIVFVLVIQTYMSVKLSVIKLLGEARVIAHEIVNYERGLENVLEKMVLG